MEAFDWDVWISVGLASRNPDHQVINDPTCTFCSSKVSSTYFHTECTPVAEFWKMAALNFSKLFKVRLPCLPATLILNDLSRLGMTHWIREEPCWLDYGSI